MIHCQTQNLCANLELPGEDHRKGAPSNAMLLLLKRWPKRENEAWRAKGFLCKDGEGCQKWFKTIFFCRTYLEVYIFLGWMIGWLWLICEETWSYKVLNSRPHETVKWMLQILFWKRWLDWICYTFEYVWCQNCLFVCFNLISQGLKFPQTACPLQPFPSDQRGRWRLRADSGSASRQWTVGWSGIFCFFGSAGFGGELSHLTVSALELGGWIDWLGGWMDGWIDRPTDRGVVNLRVLTTNSTSHEFGPGEVDLWKLCRSWDGSESYSNYNPEFRLLKKWYQFDKSSLDLELLVRWQLPSLKLTISPENRPKPKRRVVSQFQFFRGYVVLVVGSFIFVASLLTQGLTRPY